MINKEDMPKGFLIYFSLFPIIDVFNGWFLSVNISAPVGIFYRSGLLGLCIFLLIKKNSLKFPMLYQLFIINALVFGCIILIQGIFFGTGIKTSITEVSLIVKYLLLFLVCSVFIEFPLSKHTSEVLILIINGLLILGLWIPYMLRIGNYTYQNSSTGFKGFYFATNDITYAFSLMLALTVFSILQQYRSKTFYYPKMSFACIFFNVGSLALITTKFGLIFMVCMSIYGLFSLFSKSVKITVPTRFLITYLVIILLLLVVSVGYKFILEKLSGLITRIVYFYHFYDGNLINVITSSRSIYLQQAWDGFYRFSHNNYILWFGFGAVNRNNLFGRAGNIEMDLFDTIFSYGVIGLTLIMGTFYHLLKYIDKTKKSIFLIGMTFIYSTLSGHILYSGMSTMVVGFMLSILMNQKEERLLSV